MVKNGRRAQALARDLGSACVVVIAVACASKEPSWVRASIPALQTETRLVKNDEAPWMLPTHTRPEHYQLTLRLDPGAEGFSGAVEIDVNVSKPTTALVLHGRGLAVGRASVTSEGVIHEARVSQEVGADPRAEPDLLVLDLDRAVVGKVKLRIEYSGRLRDDMRAVYRTREGGKSYLFTQFEPMDARAAFPCFDEPHHKTPFSISIEVPPGNLAVANMPERTHSEVGSFVRYDFQTSLPMPTYLVAWAVGDLEARSLDSDGDRPEIRVVMPSGRGARGDLALRAARRHLSFLEGYFKSPYPYPKLDLLAVPEFDALAMENVGLVTFREELLLVTKDSPTATQGLMSSVLSHELAHMWFGDLVTLKWWDELWLNEAFATWMANKAMEANEPEFSAREGFLGWLGGAMWEDSLSTARAIRQPVKTQTDSFRSFSGITYAKGAAILDMTEGWIGSEAFRDGVVRYLDAHAWGSATSEDLFLALGAHFRPVREVMNSFTTQAGVPQIKVRAECASETVTLTLEQRPFIPLGSEPGHFEGRRWSVPVCPVLGLSKGRTEDCYLLREPAQSFSLSSKECPSWVHPNADLNGYYHGELEVADLEKLAALPAEALSHREQVGVMRFMSTALDAGTLDLDVFLRLGQVMFKTSERRQAVWDQFLGVLYQLETNMISPPQRASFEAYVGGLSGPALDRLGLTDRVGDSPHERGLRAALFAAAGELARDRKVVEWSKDATRKFLAAPASSPRDLVGRALPLAVATNDRMIFDGLLSFARTATVAEDRVLALSALGAVTQPELVRVLLDMVLEKEVSASDASGVLGALLWEPENRGVIDPWFKENFETLSGAFPTFSFREIVLAAMSRCDLDDREELESFYRAHLEKLEGMDGVLEESRDAAKRCAAFKAHHEAALRRFLAVPAARKR